MIKQWYIKQVCETQHLVDHVYIDCCVLEPNSSIMKMCMHVHINLHVHVHINLHVHVHINLHVHVD